MSMNMTCAGSVSENSFFADLKIPYDRAIRVLSLATFKQLISAISHACRTPGVGSVCVRESVYVCV